jgi:hypothetical protein
MLAIYREGVGKRPDALRMPGPRAGPVAPGMWTRRKEVLANDVPPRWCAGLRLAMVIEGRPRSTPRQRGRGAFG